VGGQVNRERLLHIREVQQVGGIGAVGLGDGVGAQVAKAEAAAGFGFLAAGGAFLCLRADSLATRWQPLGEAAWGGTTDPALRQSYGTIGIALLAFGLALVVVAVARWAFAEKNCRLERSQS